MLVFIVKVICCTLMLNSECKGHKVLNGIQHCSCKSVTNFTLVIHCETLERGAIHDCFMRHDKTQTLIFRNSNLASIPDEVNMLKHIQNVDFSENRLTHFNFSDSTCHLLREINVDFNNIEVLKNGSLDCFTNLHTLRIANNGLKEIEPGAFNKKLKHFQKLYAQYNELESLDSSVISMVDYNVTVIVNVSFNRISHCTNEANLTLGDFNKNKSFDVEAMHNNITRINITYYRRLFNITNILQLYNLWNCGIDIRFNPLICDCAIYEVALLFRIFRFMDPNNPVFSIACYNPPALRGMKLYLVPDNDFNCTVAERCPRACSCIETIGLSLLTVTCGQPYTASSLPEELPFFSEIHLNFKDSELSAIERRSYLTNVTKLDISQNKVKVIDPSIIPQLDMIQLVYLSENLLSYLPQQMKAMNFTRLSAVTLDGNPFKCDCHSLWLKKWLLKEKGRIPNEDKILCTTTGIPIVDTDDSDFVCSKPLPVNLVLFVTAAAVFILVIVPFVLYIQWTRIQVCCIANFNMHCCQKKVKTNLKYDIFLSHSSLDDDIVYHQIIPELENHDPPFRICRDDRDFIVGRTIAYNIISNIESSLTTLLVISNNFLRSEWCKMEFKQAHMKLLTEKTSNLIMIMLETPDPELMDKELSYYVKTNVYLKKCDKYFWPKLFQALPIREEITSTFSSSSSTPVADSPVASPTSSAHATSNPEAISSMSSTQRDSSRNLPSENTPLLSC